MAMPQTVPWTIEDLDRLPDDGNTYEVLNGELLVTPPPSAPHQNLDAWLSAVLTPFVVANRLGAVHHPRSVIMRDGSQVEPDLMVLPAVRFATWQTAPLPILVVEIVSRSTRRRDLHHKRDFYVKKEIPEYWAVDREERSVLRFMPGSSETVTSILTWDPRGVEAKLEIDVAVMFAETMPSP